MITTTHLANRDIRQRELIPPDQLSKTRVTVIGVGAIGRQASLQLAAIGVPKIQLIDFDAVGVENLAAQGFFEGDLGSSKVSAVTDVCRAINPAIEVVTANRKFRGIQFTGGVCFCCVDQIETRSHIFNTIRHRFDLWVDARMSAEYIRILTVHDNASMEHYPTTLFPSAEAHQESCTAKTTIYSANVAAGIMVAQLAKWLRGCDIDKDIDLNLLTNEMGAK